jgi:hypothetical protein
MAELVVVFPTPPFPPTNVNFTGSGKGANAPDATECPAEVADIAVRNVTRCVVRTKLLGRENDMHNEISNRKIMQRSAT